MKCKFFLALAFACLAVAGCGDPDSDNDDLNGFGRTTEPRVVPVKSVTMDRTAVTLQVDSVIVLVATVRPSDATDQSVRWHSSAVTVAAVADGKVMALAPGTATITATAGDKTATCLVTVEERPAPPVAKYVPDGQGNGVLPLAAFYPQSVGVIFDTDSYELTVTEQGKGIELDLEESLAVKGSELQFDIEGILNGQLYYYGIFCLRATYADGTMAEKTMWRSYPNTVLVLDSSKVVRKVEIVPTATGTYRLKAVTLKGRPSYDSIYYFWAIDDYPQSFVSFTNKKDYLFSLKRICREGRTVTVEYTITRTNKYASDTFKCCSSDTSPFATDNTGKKYNLSLNTSNVSAEAWLGGEKLAFLGWAKTVSFPLDVPVEGKIVLYDVGGGAKKVSMTLLLKDAATRILDFYNIPIQSGDDTGPFVDIGCS